VRDLADDDADDDDATGEIWRLLCLAMDLMELQRTEFPLFPMKAGLHVGPFVAGVIGIPRRFYRVFGDSINTASRMKKHSRVSHLNMSGAAKDAIGDLSKLIEFEEHTCEVKGKGSMTMSRCSPSSNGMAYFRKIVHTLDGTRRKKGPALALGNGAAADTGAAANGTANPMTNGDAAAAAHKTTDKAEEGEHLWNADLDRLATTPADLHQASALLGMKMTTLNSFADADLETAYALDRVSHRAYISKLGSMLSVVLMVGFGVMTGILLDDWDLYLWAIATPFAASAVVWLAAITAAKQAVKSNLRRVIQATNVLNVLFPAGVILVIFLQADAAEHVTQVWTLVLLWCVYVQSCGAGLALSACIYAVGLVYYAVVGLTVQGGDGVHIGQLLSAAVVGVFVLGSHQHTQWRTRLTWYSMELHAQQEETSREMLDAMLPDFVTEQIVVNGHFTAKK